MKLDKPIRIESSLSSPKIVLDYENREFEFSGRCMPENIHEFFSPILDWFEAFSKHPKSDCVFRFSLDYFNTASSKIIIRILKVLKDINDPSVYVQWNYKVYDEDVKEVGEDFIDIVGGEVIRLNETEDDEV
jgi:hypothetical protein